jgi:hypothetical protein
MEPKLDVQASDLKVEKCWIKISVILIKAIYATITLTLMGTCDKFEDETIKGLSNMQASTSLDEI